MANRRSLAKRIAKHTSLDAKQTEAVLAAYVAILAVAARSDTVSLGRLGTISQQGTPAQPKVRWCSSEGLRRAGREGTVPPKVRSAVPGE